MDPAVVVFGQSLLVGLAIAAPVGQIGVLAIQRTVQHGRAAGLATGLGAAFADAVYGAVGAFGITGVMAWLTDTRRAFQLVGSLFLLWLAWRIARRPAVSRVGVPARAPRALLGDLATTFVLTLSNPTTILSFVAIFGALAGRAPTVAPWTMVAGVLVGSALWWLVLSSVVGLVRERFDARWQRATNLASAWLLAGLAVWQLLQLAA